MNAFFKFYCCLAEKLKTHVIILLIAEIDRNKEGLLTLLYFASCCYLSEKQLYYAYDSPSYLSSVCFVRACGSTAGKRTNGEREFTEIILIL